VTRVSRAEPPFDPGPGTLAGRGDPRPIPRRVATPGMLVEVASADFAGTVVHCDAREVVLRDRRGRTRRFARAPGAFLVDDVRVELVPDPASSAVLGEASRPGPASTASGSIPAADRTPQVARASRLWVEGIHDAELIERVWGDDLRAAAIVVEPMHGADDLAAAVGDFGPGPTRRLGVLLDHLIPGSKESRLAATVHHPDVLVAGHPFVDVWAAIDPRLLGRERWPDVPRGEPYKDGLARRLGFADRHQAWAVLRGLVRTWHDLDVTLRRAVEALLDHVTVEQPRS